jgi:hypothetical protein
VSVVKDALAISECPGRRSTALNIVVGPGRFGPVGNGRRCNGGNCCECHDGPSIVERRRVKREAKGYFFTALTVTMTHDDVECGLGD